VVRAARLTFSSYTPIGDQTMSMVVRSLLRPELDGRMEAWANEDARSSSGTA